MEARRGYTNYLHLILIMVLIGSRAIRYWFDDFKRHPKDYDYVVEDKPDKIENTEFLIIPDLYKSYHTHSVLPADAIYTLKISHISWDIKWDKHISDIIFLKSKGCKVIKSLFYDLYKYWCQYHRNIRRPDFDKPNTEFFNDVVARDYPHDLLHEIVMYDSQPMFNLIKGDLNSADISESLFINLTQESKINVVREEAYVIALERFLIPGIISNPTIAYNRALKLLITRLSPIWLVLFIVDNYIQLYKPNIDFYKKFKNYELQRNFEQA